MSEQCCGTCRYAGRRIVCERYDDDDEENGEIEDVVTNYVPCRRFPPQIVGEVREIPWHTRTEHPVMQLGDWCGEWQEKDPNVIIERTQNPDPETRTIPLRYVGGGPGQPSRGEERGARPGEQR